MNAQGLQIYDITIPTNATRQLSCQGKYFRYYSGQAGGADATITIRSGTGGVLCVLKPGQSIKLLESVVDWYLGNYANAATITGFVVVGDGEITDTNIAGSVSVIDGGLARTQVNMAFLGSMLVSAVAAKYSHAQLFNPAASGKNVVVEALSFSSAAAGYFFIAGDNAQRATAGWDVFNKQIGGVVGVAVLREETNGVMQFVGPGALQYSVAAGIPQTINFREPVLLVPGKGLNVIFELVNVTITANYEYYEQPQ